MKIKNIILIILAAFSFSSCDKVKAPFREPLVIGEFCQTGINDTIYNVYHKKVLVEDYTGHLCGNCPEAGIFLNDTLKSQYNKCIVVMSVHAGYFAGTCPTAFACPHNEPTGAFTTDFNTPPGTAWNTHFGISGNPKGMVDRIGFPTLTHSLSFNAWATAIASELARPPKIGLVVLTSFDSISNSVEVTVKTKFLEGLSGNFLLQVALTEDSVIDWQEWYGHTPVYVPDYIHHHVLRDVLNTTWGEAIGIDPASGSSVIKNYSYSINSAWKANHCNIVAFVYDATTYEVIQVEETSVK